MNSFIFLLWKIQYHLRLTNTIATWTSTIDTNTGLCFKQVMGYLGVDIQNAHLAAVDDLHHRLGLDSVNVLLVLAKLDELVAHDVQTHLLLCHKVEVLVIIVAARLTGGV